MGRQKRVTYMQREFGVTVEGWLEAIQKAGQWRERVENGAEMSIMWRWHGMIRRRVCAVCTVERKHTTREDCSGDNDWPSTPPGATLFS